MNLNKWIIGFVALLVIGGGAYILISQKREVDVYPEADNGSPNVNNVETKDQTYIVYPKTYPNIRYTYPFDSTRYAARRDGVNLALYSKITHPELAQFDFLDPTFSPNYPTDIALTVIDHRGEGVAARDWGLSAIPSCDEEGKMIVGGVEGEFCTYGDIYIVDLVKGDYLYHFDLSGTVGGTDQTSKDSQAFLDSFESL